MLVPLHVRIAVRDLDEADSPLGKPPRQEALTAKVRGQGVIQSVGLQGRRMLAGERLDFRHRGLHPEGQLERVEAALEVEIRADSAQVIAVQIREQVELHPLEFARGSGRF